MEFYELIRKMEHQVNRTVKHYQDDFYQFDIPYLANYCGYKKDIVFHWFLRDTGTHIVSDKCNNADELYELYKSYNDTEYTIKYKHQPYAWSGTWSMEKVS